MDEIARLDVENSSWSEIGNLRSSRIGHSVIFVGVILEGEFLCKI